MLSKLKRDIVITIALGSILIGGAYKTFSTDPRDYLREDAVARVISSSAGCDSTLYMSGTKLDSTYMGTTFYEATSDSAIVKKTYEKMKKK